MCVWSVCEGGECVCVRGVGGECVGGGVCVYLYEGSHG